MTPSDLLALASDAMASATLQPGEKGYVVRPAGGTTLRAQPKVEGLTAGWGTQALTYNERQSRIRRAASVMLAESGGDPALVKGSKRGIWQWDEKAFPSVTDSQALDAHQATQLALLVTRAFSQFGPWHNSAGLDPASPASKTIAATAGELKPPPTGIGPIAGPKIGSVWDDILGAAESIPIIGDAIGAVSSVSDWAEGFARILSNLLKRSWWIRLGTGALGLLLIIIAVSLVKGQELLQVASKP